MPPPSTLFVSYSDLPRYGYGRWDCNPRYFFLLLRTVLSCGREVGTEFLAMMKLQAFSSATFFSHGFLHVRKKKSGLPTFESRTASNSWRDSGMGLSADDSGHQLRRWQ